MVGERLPEACLDEHPLCSSAGVMVLSQEHPRVILNCSVEPVLTPLLKEERRGTVPNVVFPTGIDRRDDLVQPDPIDITRGCPAYSVRRGRILLWWSRHWRQRAWPDSLDLPRHLFHGRISRLEKSADYPAPGLPVGGRMGCSPSGTRRVHSFVWCQCKASNHQTIRHDKA
jgi:hypothetical protein